MCTKTFQGVALPWEVLMLNRASSSIGLSSTWDCSSTEWIPFLSFEGVFGCGLLWQTFCNFSTIAAHCLLEFANGSKVCRASTTVTTLAFGPNLMNRLLFCHCSAALSGMLSIIEFPDICSIPSAISIAFLKVNSFSASNHLLHKQFCLVALFLMYFHLSNRTEFWHVSSNRLALLADAGIEVEMLHDFRKYWAEMIL